MTTTLIIINNSTWTQVTTVADFLVQNAGASPVYFSVADTTPSISTGIIINPKNGIDSTMVVGTVWAKSASNQAGIIAVTE